MVYIEMVFPHGLYNYAEKYMRTSGDAKDGLYCYNFCLDNVLSLQSSAINVNKFKKVLFDL